MLLFAQFLEEKERDEKGIKEKEILSSFPPVPSLSFPLTPFP
jgi:hypothetical protein